MIPTILVCSAHDPSGGAGVQADIEAIAANGTHSVSALTGLTVQNCHEFVEIQNISNIFFEKNLKILKKFNIKIIKIGLLTTPEQLDLILENYPNIPIVLDPVLKSGNNQNLSNQNILKNIQKNLKKIKIITPNWHEIRQLVGENNIELAAKKISQYCAVLLTGTDESTGNHVMHTLWQRGEKIQTWQWEKLPHTFHGSGCTLAASLAARLALGENLEQACFAAQKYTWESLRAGLILFEDGQALPRRVWV